MKELSSYFRFMTHRLLPAVRSGSKDRVTLDLSAELTAGLRELSQAQGVTLFVTLLGGWAVMLGRLNGQEEVLIGTHVASRQGAEVEPQIGVPGRALLRVQLEEDPTVEKLLQRVATAAMEGYAHKEAPSSEVEELCVPGNTVDNGPTPHGVGRFDLSLSINEGEGGLVGTLEYAGEVFDQETLKRWVGHWQMLLEGMVAGVRRPISQLPLLTVAQQEQVLRGFNDTAVACPQNRLIHQLFESQVESMPDAVAVICGEQRLTYVQLNRKANRLAHTLLARGVRPDRRVGLYVDRSVDMVVGLLGILKAGGAYVPLDVSYPTERLKYMLAQSAPVVLLTQERLKGTLSAGGAQAIALDAEEDEIKCGLCSNLDAAQLGLSPEHLAYVIYTSGSTGEPKGVMVEHRNVVNLINWHCAAFEVTAGSRCSCVAAVGFDAAGWEIWSPLSTGATLILAPSAVTCDPQALLTWWVDQPLDVGFLPTPMAESLFNRDIRNSELRVLLVGGDRLRHRPTSGRPLLINNYGPTESTVVATSGCIRGVDSDLHIGRPIANTQIYILDRHRRPVPIAATGEIYIGGAGIARGYLNRPDLTAERFVPDPFSGKSQARMYRSGDFGRWRSDGTIEFSGRNDQQLKIRGCRIELGEIEAQLLRHPQVKEAVVLAREDHHEEKRLVGYVVANRLQLKAMQEDSDEASGAAVVGHWKKLYEETYSSGAVGPSFVGWNSSYTGRPIPEVEMQNWLQSTLDCIGALRPRKVLEIGCGVGLLLAQLAPSCEVYRGTDLSGVALQHLRSWLRTRAELQHVQLEQCSALELQEATPGTYDTVILNSVVQYFPDIEYLRTLLKRVISWVSRGGQIFVGDVRHLGLLRVFHSSVQLARADGGVSVGELKIRIMRALEQEKELVINPLFFQELPQQLTDISGVRVLLKRGPSVNELTLYRYDVVLQIDNPHAVVEKDHVDSRVGREHVSESAALTGETHPPETRSFGVLNRRLSRDFAAVRLIEHSEDSWTVDHLREMLSKAEIGGENLDTLWKLGERRGCDVVIPRAKQAHSESSIPMKAQGDAYANDPLGKRLQEQLIPRLREYLLKRLPSYMVPSMLVVLDALPLTPNGKLDQHALPASEIGVHSSREYEAPQGEIEETLAEIWQHLLRVTRVGRHDNFFELGGHSLLIVEMMERLRCAGLPAEVRCVFASPTLATLANTLGGGTDGQFQVPPNLIPFECDAITPQMLPLVELEPHHVEVIVQAVPDGARNIQDIYPLGPLQEGILFHHLLNAQRGDTYILSTLLSLSSRKTLEDLIGALQSVIDRHDILRSAVLWERLPLPVQVVHRRAVLPVQELVPDLGGNPINLLKERMRPEWQSIGLRQAPLMRLLVATDAQSAQWYALLQLHHLIADHESLEIVIEEVVAYLERCSRALPVPLPYRNYVAQVLAHTRTHDVEAFFRKKLGRINHSTAPFGLLDVRGNGTRAADARQAVDSALAQRVREQARRFNVSAATLFHAGWGLVVAHTSGRDTVVYGSVLLGRLQVKEGAQRMLGLLINTLPLCLQLQGVTVMELVEQTQKELVELLNYEQAPLAVAQRCSGIVGSAPLFTALLNYVHSAAKPRAGWAGVQGIRVLALKEWTNYPLALSVDDLSEGFVLTAQTERSIDPHRIIGYMHAAMQSLVTALERAPDTLALSLLILPESGRY